MPVTTAAIGKTSVNQRGEVVDGVAKIETSAEQDGKQIVRNAEAEIATG